MATQQEEAITNLEALIESGQRCADQLDRTLRAYRTVLDRLQEGSSVGEALAAGDVAETRRAITTAMEEFETARRASRISLMRAEIASGVPAKTVSETWGVSRQLVSRYIHGLED